MKEKIINAVGGIILCACFFGMCAIEQAELPFLASLGWLLVDFIVGMVGVELVNSQIK